MTKIDEFVHLHTHTDHSKLDGHGTAKDTIAAVAKLNQPAIAFTDHGNMNGLYDGYYAAKEAGLGFIGGIEAYVAPSHVSHTHKAPAFFSAEGGSDDVSGRGAYTHLTLLAENNEGLANLFKLSYMAAAEGFYYKPRMSLETLAAHSKHIIATTGCPSGEVQTRLRLGQFDEALGYASTLVDIFGPQNVFVELMDHDMSIDLERSVRTGLMRISAMLNLPLVATNDIHYANKHDCDSHEELLSIQSGSLMSDPPLYKPGGTRFAFEGSNYYVKSSEEMLRLFPAETFPGAISNTMAIAERCTMKLGFNDTLRPKYPIPEDFGSNSSEDYLKHLVEKGMRERIPQHINNPEYQARIATELSVIIPKNYSDYFLVTQDLMNWARSQGIATGSGRGSAGGSLVSYLLYITDVEPVKHGLLFERFLNPERDSFPDVDLDFDDRYRHLVYNYVVSKYGSDYVAQVITFTKLKGKNSIKDVVRIHGHPYAIGDQLSKAYPPDIFGKAMPLKDIYNPASSRYADAEPFREKVKELGASSIVDSALKIEGRIRDTSVHACAVIIAETPIYDTAPVTFDTKKGVNLVQWEYPACESLGLLKMDFLGLRNLGIIQDTVDLVKKKHNVTIDIEDLKQGGMDDPEVYKLLAAGNTLGVFQLDSPPMRELLKLMKPTGFDDISAVLALYRPGPMGVNAHTNYALRKNGLQEVDFVHPEFTEVLTPVLGDTYGLCVTGDTLVWDAKAGKNVRIDSIGDAVDTGDFFTVGTDETGVLVTRKVENWWLTGKKETYRLRLESGHEITTSNDHPIYTEFGWQYMRDIHEVRDRIAIPATETILESYNDLTVDEAAALGVAGQVLPEQLLQASGIAVKAYLSALFASVSAAEVVLNSESVAKELQALMGRVGLLGAVKAQGSSWVVTDISDHYKPFVPYSRYMTDMEQLEPEDSEKDEYGVSLFDPFPAGVKDRYTYYLENFASDESKEFLNYYLVPVESKVAAGVQDVYDITVEEIHNFIANGIKVSNCIYQEQIMKIAQVVSGYSLGEADTLRRAMGKKKKEEMDKQWSRFSSGAYEQGFGKEAVQALWDMMVPFADYAFNKSHSVAYGYTSYLTAYLKTHYPAEYMSALLTSTSDDKVKTAVYLDDAKHNNIKILPPDVQHSELDYAPLDDSTILFGLKAVRNVSATSSQDIVAEREKNGSFKDLSDFMNRVPSKSVNKKVMESLSYGGGFDSFGYSRKSLIDSLPAILEKYKKNTAALKKKEKLGEDLFAGLLDFEEELAPTYDVIPVEEYPNLLRLQHERDYLGLYVSGHPLDGLNFDSVSATKVLQIQSEQVPVVPEGQYPQRGKEPIITISGIVTSWGSRPTKKGSLFGLGVIEDKTGAIDFVMFGKTHDEYASIMKTDGLYAMTGYPQKRGEDSYSFVVSSVRPLEFSTSGNLPVRVRVTVDQFEKGYHELLQRLQIHQATDVDPSGTDVVVSIRNFDGSVYEETLPFRVKPSPLLAARIRELFGMSCIGRWRARRTE